MAQAQKQPSKLGGKIPPNSANPPKLGVVRGPGTTISDSIHAKLSKDEVVLNAGAAQALKKLLGKQTIAQFNAEHAPKGAVTEVKKGVLHAAKGDPVPAPAPVQRQVAPVVREARPILDWVETPKPLISERVNNVDTVANNAAQNAPLRAQLGPETPSMGARMENSALSSANQAATLRANTSAPLSTSLANAKPQPEVTQPPNLQARMPAAQINAAEQAQTLRSTMGDSIGALKDRMPAAQVAAREGSHALRNTTGLGFQGQNGELPNFTNPELARVPPSATPPPTKTMLNPWADSKSLSGADIASKLKAGVSGFGKVAGTAGSVLALADMASQPSGKDDFLSVRAKNGDQKAAQILASGGSNPILESIKRPVREGLNTFVNQPTAQLGKRLASDFMTGTQELGGALGRNLYDVTHPANTEKPAATTIPTTLAPKPSPEQAKPTVTAKVTAKAEGAASPRAGRSAVAPDAWNQEGAGNVVTQSKTIAPGLLPASTTGTYDPQSGQQYILGKNGKKLWLPPKDEFAAKGTPQQQAYLAGLSPAERAARGGYANMQSADPTQEAASQHWFLGNQGRNSPVLDLSGGRKPPNDEVGVNGRRIQPLKVTPWYTAEDYKMASPQYYKAVEDERSNRANEANDKESNAIDKQYKLGMLDRPQAQAKDDEPAFKSEDLDMLPDTSNTERARIKTLKKKQMAGLMDALANSDVKEEGTILKEFSQASGISMKTLQEMLRR